MSLFLACQHFNSGTNLREFEDQSWFKVQAAHVCHFDSCKMLQNLTQTRECLNLYSMQSDKYSTLNVFRFPALPEKKVVGLERGPLSLVSTTEEVLDRKVADPV
jgi:hypothetical protein